MGMNQIIEMTVDIQDGTTHSYKEFSQNNLNNSELILNIADGGKEFLLEEKDKIIVYFKKPDKQFVFQDKDIVVLDKTKGKIKVLLTAQTIVVPGTVYGEISIERVEGGVKKRTSTYSFSFRVRSSLASNEVIESTNEFGPLQKGIEVGEKFKDVDFDPIIAAGVKADAALPKTGGTMTGNLNFQTKDGAKMLQWYNDQTQLGRVVFHPSGLVEWFGRNGATETSAWNYSPTTNTFNIVSNTNVVKTTGGTMTGTLNMTNSTVNWEHMFINNGGRRTRMFMDNGNGTAFTIVTEKTAGKGDWDFNEHLRVGDRRNWLKNSGDDMTGNLHLEVGTVGDRRVAWMKDGNLLWGLTSSQTALALFDWKNNRNVWQYDSTNNKLNVISDTNLLKKTGDTMTGLFTTSDNIRFKASGERSITWRDANDTEYIKLFANSGGNRLGLYSTKNAKSVWEYNGDTDTFSINTKLTTNKDGRASLTLTADAELFTANGVIADRRGNTVTLRAPFRKKSGGNTTPMFTMPADMRPLLTVLQNTSSIDGVQGLLVINSNGEVWMQDLGSTSVTGKSFYVTVTYAVD
ncbi:BppU family phage baseplate upper protein [Bacillus cereus group sp. BY112LC]|uniref:BppU family phage baseplate upper protein n=1 Tax=Bacillus cereus group sp. BY112LC TaxID=3018086 RepID=UPI0022E5D65A|nr:BppU family phage baseplate upper protein [Bacillus cereus group sp. BY112LC]MDA1874292.1 BppU family phage baseplate upper protein [Bacillus cereus group sp. BY112LC]